MKKLLLLMCAVGLFALSALAQGPANFGGTWKLDKAQSKLDPRMAGGIESMTWTVTQTGKELKIASETKRPDPQMMPAPAGAPAGMGAPPAGGPPAGGPPPGMGRGPGGRGGFGMGGDTTTLYSLDGKETIVEMDGPQGKMPVTYKAEAGAGGSMVLTSVRSFNGPNGEIKITSKETLKLSADGKTLTVDRENTSPRGTQTSTLVFAKG